MFLPIRDDVPAIRTPHVTMALIGINVLLHLYFGLQGDAGRFAYALEFGYIPRLFLDGGNSFEAQPWLLFTPLSYMFLHGGWMHLIGNMVFLWFYGNKIEEYFGSVRFALFYLASGLAAVVIYSLFNLSSISPLVGASGAIFGVMGAYMVLFPRAEITCLVFFFFITFVSLPAKVVLGIYVGYNLLMALAGSAGSNVAYLAHLGGFAFGWGLLRVLIKLRGKKMPAATGQRYHRIRW